MPRATEVRHARAIDLPVEAVEPGPTLDQRDRAVYYIAPLIDAPHTDPGDHFCRFIAGDRAQGIYRHYGFTILGELPADRRGDTV